MKSKLMYRSTGCGLVPIGRKPRHKVANPLLHLRPWPYYRVVGPLFNRCYPTLYGAQMAAKRANGAVVHREQSPGGFRERLDPGQINRATRKESRRT